MTLSDRLFTFGISGFWRISREAPRFFAHGRAVDPKTAMAVEDLSPHLLKDIGITDNDLAAKPMDKPRWP